MPRDAPRVFLASHFDLLRRLFPASATSRHKNSNTGIQVGCPRIPVHLRQDHCGVVLLCRNEAGDQRDLLGLFDLRGQGHFFLGI
jgi:hypothetical protein